MVLDLDGDGVAPTSQAEGVRFDLLGMGPMRSAWVRGYDALLVMDRNGNGVIDDGGELFGSATDLGGALASDGFQALAALDTNGNSLVEAEDIFWSGLRLWRDANTDGLSQQEELLTLEEAGVRSLSVQGGRPCGEIVDVHGNDLSLRSFFTRADGSRGLMVDVFFRISR